MVPLIEIKYLGSDEVRLTEIRVIALLLCLLPEHAELRQYFLPIP